MIIRHPGPTQGQLAPKAEGQLTLTLSPAPLSPASPAPLARGCSQTFKCYEFSFNFMNQDDSSMEEHQHFEICPLVPLDQLDQFITRPY